MRNRILIGDNVTNQLATQAVESAARNGGSLAGVNADLVTQPADSMLAEAA